MKEYAKMLALAIVNRLKEKSTWAFIFGILTTVGVSINPELNDQAVNAGIALATLAGTLLAVTPDKK